MRAPVRTALSVLGRTVWAVLVLALGVAVVVGATRFPGETSAPLPLATAVAPPATSVLVCPGPLRLATEQAGDDAAYDPAFDPSPADATSDLVAVTSTADPSAAGAAGTGASLVPLAGGEPVGSVAAGVEAGVLGLALGSSGGAPLVVRADPAVDVPAWASGAVAWRAGTGDLRGLAAASCQRPSATTWLVGGSTELGSSARLVLQNPGATPATVSLRVWGARGPVELAGAPDYLVGPGEQEMVLLEGLAAEQGQVVVQVAATGGLVSAYLQDSRTDGLTPQGVDLVVGGAGPATELMVPAISVTDDDPEAAVLRVLAPGDGADGAHGAEGGDGGDGADDRGAVESGTVHVMLLGPQGAVELPGAEDVSIDAGQVIDIPLDGLPAGDYSAWVTGDLPVVAGAAVTRLGTAPTGEDVPVERAWSPAQAGGLSAPLALPGDEEGRLVLAAAPVDGRTGSSRVEVVTLDASGAVLVRKDVLVPVGGTVALDLAGLAPSSAATGQDARAAALVLRTEDPRVAWAVVLDTGDSVAVLAPVTQPAASPEVTVTVR